MLIEYHARSAVDLLTQKRRGTIELLLKAHGAPTCVGIDSRSSGVSPFHCAAASVCKSCAVAQCTRECGYTRRPRPYYKIEKIGYM